MIKNVTIDSFNSKISKGISLVDFYAEWCGPCKMLLPILNELNEELEEVSFYKVDIDKEDALAQELHIMSVPTLLLYKDGIIVNKTSGFSPKEMIKEFIIKAM